MAESIDPHIINYYLILGLDYDDDKISAETITSVIKQKQSDWSLAGGSNKLYWKYLELVKDDIPRVMNDPVSRKQHASVAKDLLGNSLLMFVMRIAKNKSLTEEQLENAAKFIKEKFEKTPGSRTLLPPLDEFKTFVAKKAKSAGFSIITETTDFQSIYDKYYKNKPQNVDIYNSKLPELSQLGFTTFYEFLGMDERSPVHVLLDTINEKKRHLPVSKADNTLTERMCNAALDIFKDETSKHTYDEYCLWKKRRDLLDELGDLAKDTGITEDIRADYFKQLSQQLGAKLADELIIAYCKKNKIKDVKNSSVDVTNIKICRRCKTPNLLTAGQKTCSSCGSPLFIQCPQCGKEISLEIGIDVCSCGFNIKNIDRAFLALDEAEKKIVIMDLDVASKLISDAEGYWKNNPLLPKIQKELTDASAKFGNIKLSLNKAIEENCFFAAQKFYKEIQVRIPGYADDELKNKIENRIKESEAYYQLAKGKTNDGEILDICAKSIKICKDNDNINTLLRQYPPEAPSSLKVITDNVGKYNVLSWSPSPSKGNIRYLVVRKRDNAPTSEQDGELIEFSSSCSYSDNKIDSGVCYYYAIYTERSGIYSPPLHYSNSPVYNISEISSFRLTPGDKTIRLEWPLIPKNAKISLYRSKDNEKETAITKHSDTGYLDSNLINGSTYTYRLSLTYFINGKEVKTKGITQSAVPISIPREIDSLRINQLSENNFELSWENPENSDIQFFSSEQEQIYKIGQVVPIEELEQKLNKLPLTKLKDNKGSFAYSGDSGLYVTCVAVKSSTAVVGNFVRARNGNFVKINAVELVNNKIVIWLDYPKETTGFIISTRFDTFEQDPYNKQVSNRKYTSIRSFLNDGSNTLQIENPEKRDYYISVFAESKINGTVEYSSPTTYLFKNRDKIKIYYSVLTIQKGLFSAKKTAIILEIPDHDDTMLPDIEVYAANLRPPMFQSSGTYWGSMTNITQNEKITVPLTIPSGSPKNMHIKLFFKNKSDYEKYELLLDTNAKTQVT